MKIDEKPPIDRVAGKAVVVLVRKGIMGSAIDRSIYIDGILAGKTTGFSYFVTTVEPGMYFLTSSQQYHGEFMTVRTNFKAGRIYYFEQKDAAFVIVMAPITEEQFLSYQRTCKNSTLKPDVKLRVLTDFDSLRNEYLKALAADPKSHEDTEMYEGY